MGIKKDLIFNKSEKRTKKGVKNIFFFCQVIGKMLENGTDRTKHMVVACVANLSTHRELRQSIEQQKGTEILSKFIRNCNTQETLKIAVREANQICLCSAYGVMQRIWSFVCKCEHIHTKFYPRQCTHMHRGACFSILRMTQSRGKT